MEKPRIKGPQLSPVFRQLSLSGHFKIKKRKSEDGSTTPGSFFASPSCKARVKRSRLGNNQLSMKDCFKSVADKKSDTDSKTGSETSTIVRCQTCLQNLEDPDLIQYERHPEGAKPEFEAICDESLLHSSDGLNNLPRFKVTQFCLYDLKGHVVGFNTNLIRRNKQIFFSGLIKSESSEDCGMEGGVPVKDAGPITALSRESIVTEVAVYCIMEPAAIFEPFMKIAEEKMKVGRNCISLLNKWNKFPAVYD